MSPNASTIPLKGQLERLKALVDLARMLASELSLPEIIHHVLIGAIEVIPSADAGTLYLYDKASGKLRASDSVGLGEEMFSIALEPGEGAADAPHGAGCSRHEDRVVVFMVRRHVAHPSRTNLSRARAALHETLVSVVLRYWAMAPRGRD